MLPSLYLCELWQRSLQRNAQNGTETILKGAEGETIPKKNKKHGRA